MDVGGILDTLYTFSLIYIKMLQNLGMLEYNQNCLHFQVGNKNYKCI